MFTVLVATMLLVTPPIVLGRDVRAVLSVARVHRRFRVILTGLAIPVVAVAVVIAFRSTLIWFVGFGIAIGFAALLLRPAVFPDDKTLGWSSKQQRRYGITMLAGDLSASKRHPLAGYQLVKALLAIPEVNNERIWVTVSVPADDEDDERTIGWRLVRMYSRMGFRIAGELATPWGTAVGLIRMSPTPRTTRPATARESGTTKVARAVLERLLVPTQMLRRVETYELPDAVTICRTTRFDTIINPELEMTRSAGRREIVVPLSFARKRRSPDDMLMLRNLEARGSRGEILGVITRFENARLTYWALDLWMSAIAGRRRVDPTSRDLLWAMVQKPGIEAEVIFEEVRRAALDRPCADVHAPALCRAVVESEMFASLLKITVTTFLLGVSAPATSGAQRDVITLTHEATLDLPRSGVLADPMGALGLRAVAVPLAQEPVLATRAIHVEVENPGELIDLADDSDSTWDNRLRGEPCAHLGWASQYWRPKVVARFALRPSQGLPAIGAMVALTGLLCAFASLELPERVWRSGAALVLLFPGAVSGLSAVRKRHSVAEQLVLAFRVCLAAGVATSVAAAAVVTVTTGAVRHRTLVGLACVSAVVLVYALWVGLGLRTWTRWRLAKKRRPALGNLAASLWPRGRA